MTGSKIVLDTNVIVSGILFGGNPRGVIQSVIEGRSILYISTPILEEIEAVLLRPKFKLNASIVRNLVYEIEQISIFAESKKAINIVKKDPDDNKFIECAIASNSEFIISGDVHLLEIKKYRKIKIITPQEYLMGAR